MAQHRRLLILLFVLAAAASSVTGQSFGSIKVKVLAPGGDRALPGAEVTLSGGGLVEPRHQITNDEGETFFLAVPSGPGYALSVSAEECQNGGGSIGRIYASMQRSVVGVCRASGWGVPPCNQINWLELTWSIPLQFVVPQLRSAARIMCL